ncbi:MAG: prephenate dehydratase [Acidiferrobacterales bacterium]|nr:prephenate dehydratase [Acidiferrobacterales bacterium]
MSEDSSLKKIREKIDAIDEKIQALITERAQYAKEVATTKLDVGAESFYRPEREAEVLRRVIERNTGPVSNDDMARLFREIMSVCLALESPLTVAYLGPEGTFTQQAALKHFGHSVETVALAAIDEVFREVEAGSAQFGVVPIENSTEGVVSHTLDMFMRSDLQICGEVQLRVHQHLLSNADRLDGIRKIVSHQQSLAQCREWLDANLPNVERVPVSSNAEAARIAANDNGVAAIAGQSAAEIYTLKVLAGNIEDEPDNTTRFLVIGRLQTMPSGKDKTSLLLSGKNKPGALYQLLGSLANHGINMTRIESRPSRQNAWEYVFFLDIEGHAEDKKVKKTLSELQAEAALFKLLGSYPVSVR